MSIHRFFLHTGDRVNDTTFTITSEELLHQWKKVLRFQTGEKVVLFDGSGKEYSGEIIHMTPKAIEGKVTDSRTCNTELSSSLILAQSILKSPEKFEWVLQKGTELGVSEFYPLITKRTERSFLHKMDRLNRIIIEAAEQCGRATVPTLHEPITFEKFLKLERLKEKDSLLLIPHVGTDKGVGTLDIQQGSIYVCVGPEGGFEDREVSAAQESGATVVSLGHRVLRSETASIAIATLIASKIEHF